MGVLTAVMTAELLLHNKTEGRDSILNWLWKGDYWKRHKALREQRIPNTGTWFLELDSFKNWVGGNEGSLLMCLGMRTTPSQ